MYVWRPGVNVKGQCRLWSPLPRVITAMFRYSPLRYRHIYITLNMMIVFIKQLYVNLCSDIYIYILCYITGIELWQITL